MAEHSDCGDRVGLLQRWTEGAAEALAAEIVLVVRDGHVLSSVGFGCDEVVPLVLLDAVTTRPAALELPSLGPYAVLVDDVPEPVDAQLLVARRGDPALTAEDAALLRGLAHGMAITLRMVHLLDAERAARTVRGRAARESLHDAPITNLPNRALCLDRHVRVGVDRAGHTAGDADLAMDRAGAGCRELEEDLRRAVESDSLHVVYQPVVELVTNRIVGLEALARWDHPTRGSVPPLEFIPVAEECGLIERLDSFVLAAACADMGAWRRAHPAARDVNVAVNVSGPELHEPRFADRVIGELARNGLRASSLVLEVTETSVLGAGIVPVAERLGRLRRLGMSIALDDFGTGYSSLSYLRQLPVNIVKVDRSFVADVAVDADQRELTAAIMRLGMDLRLDTVAEGIETVEQLQAVRSMGCLYGQGFLFSRPQPPAVIGELFAAQSAPGARSWNRSPLERLEEASGAPIA